MSSSDCSIVILGKGLKLFKFGSFVFSVLSSTGDRTHAHNKIKGENKTKEQNNAFKTFQYEINIRKNKTKTITS